MWQTFKTFLVETGIVLDACVAYLANRMCGNREKALRRWNEELDRIGRAR